MSFWSSLVLAHAAPPPVVTTTKLAAFLRSLVATRALAAGEDVLCQVKYGPRIDADDRRPGMTEWDGAIGTDEDYPWDRSEAFPSVGDTADALEAETRTVYRAHFGLGWLLPEAVAGLTREPSPENEVGLCLSDLGFTVGPVVVGGLGTDAEAFAGWMGLAISGPGYFFPWEYREARERAGSIELVRRLAEVCRQTWPVPPVPVTAEVVAGRQGLSDLWLYDDFVLPQGWWWFVDETG